MSRFERIDAYPGTYFTLLPLELRAILSLYIYHCNYRVETFREKIGRHGLQLSVVTNGIYNTINIPEDIIPQIPQLINNIYNDRITMIRGNDLDIGYAGSDFELLIKSSTFITLMPLCKKLLDELIKLTEL